MSHREEHVLDTEEIEKTNKQEKTGNKRELTTTGSEKKRRKRQSSPSTPSKNRIQQPPNNLITPSSHHSGSLLSNESSDRETLNGIIPLEARGQTRIYVTLSEFSERFLSRLKRGVIPRDTHIGLFEALNGRNASGKWEEQTFYEDVLKNMEIMCEDLNCALQFRYDSNRPPSGSSKKAKPNFLILKKSSVGPTERPVWKDVECVIEHSSQKAEQTFTHQFSQWLRKVWWLFNEQPYRRFCFGIMFLRPDAFLCYADHGCAAVSEPLHITCQADHLEFLVQFLTSFMKSSDHERGRDPDIVENNGTGTISHDSQHWTIGDPIFHLNSLVGRNIMVFNVTKDGERPRVCKSVWEEIPASASNINETLHLPESVVIGQLQKAGVEGLPMIWDIEHAKVESQYAKTASLPTKGRVFQENMSKDTLTNITNQTYSVDVSASHLIGKAAGGLTSARLQQQHFFSPTTHERQLYRIFMSKCEPLNTRIQDVGLEALMPIIRDAMICYYECYKIPSPGWLQADISNMNILATTSETLLTGQKSEMTDRKGTIIDWNYSYRASGLANSGHSRSGTPAFMALDLLDVWKEVPRRTIRHDLESFFAVVLFMATRYHNEKWDGSPLASAISPNQNTQQIYNAKSALFRIRNEFKQRVLNYLSPKIPDRERFKKLLEDIRSSLYPLDYNNTIKDGEVTKTCKDLFERNISFINEFLGDRCGVTSLREIDKRKALNTPATRQTES